MSAFRVALFFVCCFSFSISKAQSFWQTMNSPNWANPEAMAVAPDKTVYAALTDRGIFRLSPNSNTWESLNNNFPVDFFGDYRSVTNLVVTSDGKVYALIESVVYFLNNNQSWEILSENINNETTPIVLIGHSLGGILSQEIAKIKKINTIILVSSIHSRAENPFYFKIIQPLRLQHFFTKGFTTKTVKYWGKTHGYETEEEQTLFKNMVNEQSNHYLQWALKTLSMWQPTPPSASTKIIQIHGDVDKTFPFKNIKQADYLVKGGGHFMVFKQAKIIENMIVKILETAVY